MAEKEVGELQLLTDYPKQALENTEPHSRVWFPGQDASVWQRQGCENVRTHRQYICGPALGVAVVGEDEVGEEAEDVVLEQGVLQRRAVRRSHREELRHGQPAGPQRPVLEVGVDRGREGRVGAGEPMRLGVKPHGGRGRNMDPQKTRWIKKYKKNTNKRKLRVKSFGSSPWMCTSPLENTYKNFWLLTGKAFTLLTQKMQKKDKNQQRFWSQKTRNFCSNFFSSKIEKITQGKNTKQTQKIKKCVCIPPADHKDWVKLLFKTTNLGICMGCLHPWVSFGVSP